MNFSLQDKPCSNQMADSWFPTAVISHFYSAVYERSDAPTFVGYLKEMQRNFGGGGGDGQGLHAPRQAGQEAAAGEQKHQDHLPFEGIPIPQCGREMLALRKTSPAHLRILSDVC